MKVNGNKVSSILVRSSTTMDHTISVNSLALSSRTEKVNYTLLSLLFPTPLLKLKNLLNTLVVFGREMLLRVVAYITYSKKLSATKVNYPTGPSLVRARDCMSMAHMKVNS